MFYSLLGKERSFQRHNVRAEQRTSLKGKRVGDETPQSISQSLGKIVTVYNANWFLISMFITFHRFFLLFLMLQTFATYLCW